MRLGLLLAAVGALTLAPQAAQACGGLFCNAPPPDPFAPLPVAQNGENVVFSITPDPAGGAPTLVAHIQIMYTGDAAKFSWVVPVDAAPQLSVGTDRLFSSLASVTQPQFLLNYALDGTCLPDPYIGSGGARDAAAGSGGASGTGSGGSSGTSNPGGVTVSFQGAVGPFDAAVIMADDPMALKNWLVEYGYTVTDAAAALIDVYVREHKYFVALKLLNGVGVRSIQPIVLTFRGTEPCVPLRLTAVAANPDMPVLLWVFSDKRIVPKGFHEMTIDQARIDWLFGGSNYFGPNGLVSQAANEAGGKAFVTEYAGPANLTRNLIYFDGQFDLSVLQAAMTPVPYIQGLIGLGLTSDAQMLPLLAEYIPMPQAVKDMGVTESQFYGNIQFYFTQYAFPAYDLPGLTQAIQTKIIKPRQDAQKMMDARPYLTRLNTYLSPDEMNADPLFFENRDLGDVSNVHTSTLRTMCGNREYMACNAPLRLEFPDGRMAWVRSGSNAATCMYRDYDASGLQSLPAMEQAFERSTTGEGTRVADKVAAIRAGLSAHNNTFRNEQARFPIGADGRPSDGWGVSSSDSKGCACEVAAGRRGTMVAGVVALLALACGVVRRRRRR